MCRFKRIQNAIEIRHRAAGHRVRAMIPRWWEVLKVFGFLLGGKGRFTKFVKFYPHDFVGLLLAVLFERLFWNCFLEVSTVFLAAFRDCF